MSDLLNFLTGLGGGYLKGADLMSKRKAALETAKLNNAIRQQTLEQQRETADLNSYGSLVNSYDKTLAEAMDSINKSATPEDQINNARLYAGQILDKHNQVFNFAKTSKHVAARGLQLPKLPDWVSSPDSASQTFARGAQFMNPADWARAVGDLGTYESFEPKSLVDKYVSLYGPMLGPNPTREQVNNILSKYPVNAKHLSIEPQIRQGLESNVVPTPGLASTGPSLSTVAAPSVTLPTPPPNSPLSLGSNNRPFSVGTIKLADGRFFNPATASLPSGGAMPPGGTMPLPGGAMPPGAQLVGINSAASATGNTNAVTPLDLISSGTGTDALTGEYKLGGYTVPPAKQPKKTEDEILNERIASYGLAAKNAQIDNRKWIDKSTKAIDDNVRGALKPIGQLYTQAYDAFNSPPKINYKYTKDFLLDDNGFPRSNDTAQKLAEQHNATENFIQKAYYDRQTAIKGLYDMAVTGAKLPGEIKQTELENLDKAFSIGERDLFLPIKLRTDLANAHTAVVNAVFAATKIQADIRNATTTANAAATNAATSKLRLDIDAAGEALKELSGVRQETVKSNRGVLASYQQQNTDNGAAVAQSKSQILGLSWPDPQQQQAVNAWFGYINNNYGAEDVLKKDVKDEEARLWAAIPQATKDYGFLASHRTNMTIKQDLKTKIGNAAHNLEQSVNELQLIDNAYESIRKGGATLLDYATKQQRDSAEEEKNKGKKKR